MRVTVILFIVFIASTAHFQSWNEIISNADNYQDAIEQVESYFDQKGRGKGTGYKQFRRWKSKMDPRVSRSGKVQNFELLNFKAYRKARKKSVESGIRSTNGDWSEVGPLDYSVFDSWSTGGIGRVVCSAFHPTDANTWYVGAAAGGMWKTQDNGQTWSPMTDHFASIGISAIVVNQVNPNTIYILTGDARASDSESIGVLKTTDGGMTWETTAISFHASESRKGFTMVASPVDPDILFIAINGIGLFKSDDGLATVDTVINDGSRVWDIEFIPGDPTQMLCSSTTGLQRSSDSGDTWVIDGDPAFPTGFDRFDIAVCPSLPSNVYVIFNGDTGINGTFNGCFRSTDFGSTFTMQSTTPNIFGSALDGNNGTDQGARDLGFAVDPTNHLRLFAGGVNIWKSENGGVTWGRETWRTRNFAESDPYVHADQQNFYWKNTDTLLVNNDGGVFYTANFGHSWTELTEGLGVGQFYEIDVHNNEYIGGMQDNGTMKGNFSDIECSQILGGDGFGCAWHTGDHSIKYLSTQASIIRRQFGSNIIIWDGFGAFAFWEAEIEMHTTNSNYFFVDRGNQLFRSSQIFEVWNFDWEDLGTDALLTGDDIRGFSQCTFDPNIMYVVNQDSVLKTTNLSHSSPMWTTCTTPPVGGANIRDVVVNPNNGNQVWVACSSYEDGMKVFRSNDGGSSWENISGSIENVPVRCIEYHSGTNPGLYIGTEIGVYYRGNTMSDWISFANYLPNTVVDDIEIDGGYITVGTHGRGIWRSPIFSPCPSNLTLTPANDPSNPQSIGHQIHQASNTITSTRLIQGSSAEIFYRSGNYIDMKPGFEAKKATFFDVKIGGCID